MNLVQLAQRQPDQLFIEGLVQIGLHTPGNFPRRRLSVAAAPNQGRRAIKTMSSMPVEIVDQNFIRQLVNY